MRKRKYYFILVAMLISMVANAQTYNRREVLDKFDDTVSNTTNKTLITVETADSMMYFTFEVKGKKPVTYIGGYMGSIQKQEGEPVNLVANVWGYEDHYLAHSKDGTSIVEIVHRTITTQYIGEYENDMWWIRFSDGKRIIYTRY